VRQASQARAVAGRGGRVKLQRDLLIPGPGGTIPVRQYVPLAHDSDRPLPLLLYLHGGGFVLGSPDTHDNLCRALARRAGCVVVSVDYRLAPEHPFPAAVDDAYAALQWAAAEAPALGADPHRLGVAGDSAGGNLAAVLCLRSREEDGPAIRHQALIYPATDATNLDRESHRRYGRGYFLDLSDVVWFLDQYLPRHEERGHPYASPLLAPRLAGLPSATVVTAEFDLLRDEGEAYAEALGRAGVPVRSRRYSGVVHGFASALRFLPKARQAVGFIAEGLKSSWEG
jgi:acetyl esterase